MKKHLLSLFFLVALLVPAGLFAQSADAAKGKHGGFLVSSDQRVFFEIVDDGSKIAFYPCTANGDALSNPPATVDISIVLLSTTEQANLTGVALVNGAYVVSPERPYPVYMYAVKYNYNDQKGAVKFRRPDMKQAR